MFNFFIFLVAYLPFQLALSPVSGVDLASIRLLILGLFSVWLMQGLKNKQIKIKLNLQTGLIISFLFLNAFSLIVARNVDWSLRKLIFFLSIFPIYFVASSLIVNLARLRQIVRMIVFGGVGVASIAIVQFLAQFIFGLEKVYFFWSKYVVWPFLGSGLGEAVLKNPSWLVNISGKTYLRAIAFFPDPHMLAFYLGLILPLTFIFVLDNKQKQLSWLFFGLIFLADVLTFSRGGYVALFAAFIVGLTVFWWRIEKKYQWGILIVILLGLSSVLVPSPISERFFSSLNLKEGSNQGRLAMWQKAWDVTQENLWLGVGLSNYPLEVKPTAVYRDPIYAHNTYLDIAAETGIINMLVWLMMLGVIAYEFWIKSQKETVFLMSLTSLLIFAIHSVFETAIYSPVVITLFLIIISFSNVEVVSSSDTRKI